MAVDERARLNLYLKLEEVLGAENADTLMSLLPPVGQRELATKDDLRIRITELQAEIAGLRSELRAVLAGSKAR